MRTIGQSRVEMILFGRILEKESVSPVALQVVGDTWVSNSSVVTSGLTGNGGTWCAEREDGRKLHYAFCICCFVYLLYCEFFGVSTHLCCEFSALHSGFQSPLTVLRANIE